jgi:hypothetical protein
MLQQAQVQGLAARPAAWTALQAAPLSRQQSRQQSQAGMQQLQPGLRLMRGSFHQALAVFALTHWARQGAHWWT